MGWNLPDSDEISFVVIRAMDRCGMYRRHAGGRHEISISQNGVGYLPTLLAIMAHGNGASASSDHKMEGRADHGAVFKHFAARVCAVHGFDPKLF